MARSLLKEDAMRIAIAHWQGRVSPVFDVSDHLLLIDIVDGGEQSRQDINLSARDPFDRAKEVSGLGVDVLLCGAVSRVLETSLCDAGVLIFGFVCGGIETVITAFLLGQLSNNRFLMPGCSGKRKTPRFSSGRRGKQKSSTRAKSRLVQGSRIDK
jgi:predicted Fe-Mo cluster-binding NifX family protein